MRYAHILSAVTNSPWFITSDALHSITDLLEARLSGVQFAPREEIASDEVEKEKPVSKPYAVRNSTGVAVVSARGILGKHLSAMELECGGADYDSIANSVEVALADPTIARAILHMSSRGGTANGCPETFARIRAAKAASGKPLIGYIDTLACSAGLYVLAACDMIFITESAMAGSIGTILTVEDRTEKNAKDGVKRFAIKTASMKDIGSPDRAMTPEELTFLQGQMDFLGGLFKRDMHAARPQIAAEVYEKGLAYFGPQAVALGLADGLVGSLDELIASLSTPQPASAI